MFFRTVGALQRVLQDREKEQDSDSTLGPVGSAECSGVEADRALGDGEADAKASGVGTAGLIDAIEGTEDVAELSFGDDGALIRDFNGGESAGGDGCFGDAKGYLDVRVRVADGVADDVFDGAIE